MTDMEEKFAINTLKDIPGYGGKYKANPTGQIVHAYRSGKVRLMTQYLSHNKFAVKLTADGIPKEIPAATLILLTFKGSCPEGMVPHHKNGIKSDNRLDNLGYIQRGELGRKTGKGSRSQSVIKMDRDGNAVEVYYSAREAARKNNMSYQTVIDRCNGRVKKPFALDGHTYVWEDSRVSIKRVMRLLGKKM